MMFRSLLLCTLMFGLPAKQNWKPATILMFKLTFKDAENINLILIDDETTPVAWDEIWWIGANSNIRYRVDYARNGKMYAYYPLERKEIELSYTLEEFISQIFEAKEISKFW